MIENIFTVATVSFVDINNHYPGIFEVSLIKWPFKCKMTLDNAGQLCTILLKLPKLIIWYLNDLVFGKLCQSKDSHLKITPKKIIEVQRMIFVSPTPKVIQNRLSYTYHEDTE